MTDYRKGVLRTANHDFEKIMDRFSEFKIVLSNAAMGLAGESGEFVDLVKKIVFHGKTAYESREKLLSELGDIRWYLELAAYALDTTMEEIEQINLEKLRRRYPDGFTEKASKDRVDTLPDSSDTAGA